MHPITRLLVSSSFAFLGASGLFTEIAHSGDCAQGPKALLKSSNGKKAYVHPSAVKPFECLLKGLDGIRYPIKFVGGYGCRPLRTSNHPRGLAIDVNQYSRDVTKPNVYGWNATKVANSCNLTHGAVWRNPDAGHFEIRSQSRGQQQSRRSANGSGPSKRRRTATYADNRPGSTFSWQSSYGGK